MYVFVAESIVKARWKNLRDSYRKIIKKLENLETDDPKWPYFKSMEFMRDITLNTKPRNVDITMLKSEIVSIEPDYSITLSAMDEGMSAEHSSLEFFDRRRENVGSAGSQGTSGKQETKPGRPRIPEDLAAHFLELGNDRCKHEQDRISPSLRGLQEDDDFQFLLSLIPHLKQVPTGRKLPLRIRIEQLIYEELYNVHYPNFATFTPKANFALKR